MAYSAEGLAGVRERIEAELKKNACWARVLVPIADGSEDIEVACIVDVLRRAKIAVWVCAVPSARIELILASPIDPDSGLCDVVRTVKLARGLLVMADFVLYGPSSELDVRRSYYDAIVLPGGMPGASNLAASPTLSALLKAQRQTGLWIAAICASPAVVLAPLGLLDGVTSATCYPAASFTAALPPGCDTSARVAVDVPTKTITSAGPGTAIEFALQIVASLGSEAAAREVGAALLLPTPLSLCHSPEGRVGRAPEGVYAP